MKIIFSSTFGGIDYTDDNKITQLERFPITNTIVLCFENMNLGFGYCLGFDRAKRG